MTYDVYRKYMSNVFLGENGILSFPEWTISEETNELFGYSVRKATAQYMGRNWTVWFTEEIPVPGQTFLKTRETDIYKKDYSSLSSILVGNKIHFKRRPVKQG